MRSSNLSIGGQLVGLFIQPGRHFLWNKHGGHMQRLRKLRGVDSTTHASVFSVLWQLQNVQS